MQTQGLVSDCQPCTMRRNASSGAKRFNVMCCGRRFGKNVLLQDMAARSALAGHPVGWFAPTYKMQVEDWRTVTERLKPVTKSANAADMRLELITGA